jgi:hypothetical protein
MELGILGDHVRCIVRHQMLGYHRARPVRPVKCAISTVVGVAVGAPVGSSVGAVVGSGVGSMVGEAVGSCEREVTKARSRLCHIRRYGPRRSLTLVGAAVGSSVG